MDKTRPSRIPPLEAEVAPRVVVATQADPPGETPPWPRFRASASVRCNASGEGTVCSQHRTRLFKLSNDPQFAAKLSDIVGLYVDPPAHAVVLSIDEWSQIQALDRTQPGLPMKKADATP